MTWGCEVLRDEIWRERAILEGNWGKLTFAKTSGTVTREKGKMTKNDRADRRVPTWVRDPRKNCGKYFSPNRFKSGEWTCCAQRPRKGVNGRRLVATIGIGLSIENLKARHLWTKFRLRLSRNVMDLQCKKTKTKMQGDFCNNYLPKIEFFKTRSGLSELRKKKTPLGHLLNETQFPFSSSTNFLERKEGIFPFSWTKLCLLWLKEPYRLLS